MSIKQNGGVFGRNPTFNDVTIEGQLTFDGDIDINSDLKINGDLEVDGSATVTQGISLITLGNIGPSGNAGLRISRDDTSISNNPLGYLEFGGRDSTGNVDMPFAHIGAEANGSHSAGSNPTDLVFGTTPTGAEVITDRMRISREGNVSILTGDLIISTSGAGIDFSATAGTGTSELLDDYEEGNWTPEYAPASGAFGSITYDTVITGGKYTKVGNLVHIQGGIRTNAITVGSASGGIRLSGLPFPAIASGTGQDGWSTLTVGQAVAFAGDVPSLGSIVAGQSYIELQYRSAANGATIDLNVADLDTGASDNLMRFSATYISG